ncbi:MAG TPA: DinB family protein [Bryobacteraceae bacterium]|nr:DinB family protein [Bryobacteraceae bacterium]
MFIPADVVRSHIDYTAWASGLLVDAAAQLTPAELTRDFGTADKSVLGTLVHVFGADRVWLARMPGEPANQFLTDADYRLSVLQNDWPVLYRQWKDWAAALTDQASSAEMSYRDMRGNPWRQPAGQLVLHVVNHGTHHRGQVSGFLRAMGYAPPKLDLVGYYRDMPPR